MKVLAASLALLVAALPVTAGCTGARPERARGPDQSPRLTARLDSPTDITLTWQDRPQGIAGRIVEFATARHGPYTILEFLPPGQTTFTHPDLIPDTPFYYRLRPYYGPASEPVRITVPGGPPSTDDDHAWASPQVTPGGPATRRSIRHGDPAAAPTVLRGKVMNADGIRFTWVDRAADEEGHLLEVRPAGSPGYRVAAVVDADINSYGLITMPAERSSSYRVRAFYYGPASNLAYQHTGAEPAG